MNQYQIAVLVGSLRRESHNRALASAQGWMDRYVDWVKQYSG
jgi:NAD(P)H-dependent FMN reductase